jgi:hypothetical protein
MVLTMVRIFSSNCREKFQRCEAKHSINNKIGVGLSVGRHFIGVRGIGRAVSREQRGHQNCSSGRACGGIADGCLRRGD